MARVELREEGGVMVVVMEEEEKEVEKVEEGTGEEKGVEEMEE